MYMCIYIYIFKNMYNPVILLMDIDLKDLQLIISKKHIHTYLDLLYKLTTAKHIYQQVDTESVKHNRMNSMLYPLLFL